jgi:alpha-1,4-digalacturonate transport system substrate-binding protein
VLFNALISRLNEAIVGEISLEDAYARMESDITNQLAESGR